MLFAKLNIPPKSWPNRSGQKRRPKIPSLGEGQYPIFSDAESKLLCQLAMIETDLNKSLQDLDGEDWGDPAFDTHLVQECHRLRRVPLCQFETEDLRIMIGQDIGLEYLVPVAIAKLNDNPLAEGDMYPGDLLANVLSASSEFWRAHPELHKQLIPIAERALSLASADEEICTEVVVQSVTRAYELFKRQSRTRA